MNTKKSNNLNLRKTKPKTKSCLHDACENCGGTGTDDFGMRCVHHIACPCPKHSLR